MADNVKTNSYKIRIKQNRKNIFFIELFLKKRPIIIFLEDYNLTF